MAVTDFSLQIAATRNTSPSPAPLLPTVSFSPERHNRTERICKRVCCVCVCKSLKSSGLWVVKSAFLTQLPVVAVKDNFVLAQGGT